MNIFNKVAFQSLKKSRTRTLVTIIGVILSAAMITAVATFGISLLNYMTEGAASKYGGWQAAFLDVDSSFAQERMSDKEVADSAVFENIGYAELSGVKDSNKPYLFIAGFYEETFDALPVNLLSGRLPENSGEILVSGKIPANGNASYAVGDTLSLAVGTRTNGTEKLGQTDPYTDNEALLPKGQRTYTIVGVCQTPSFEEDNAPGYTLITRTDASDTADDLSIFITLKNPRRVHAYVKTSADGHACILNHNVLRFMGLSDSPSDKIFNALLYSVGIIVIVIIMIGSIFLIYNAFSISLNERIQQIGILASVGATAKQLRNSVLFEGLCIGAAGIPIGILVGTGSIGLVISVVSKNFGNILYADVPLTMHVSALAIAGAAAVSLLTIIISAYIPARKAAAMPVMECIRQSNEVKVESKAMKTSKLAQRIYGLEGVLALKNFKRNKKRYRSIVLSLVLSIVLFVSTSAFVASLKKAAEQAKMVTSYDIGFGTQDMNDSEMLELYDRLKNVGGVYESSYQVFMDYSCAVPADTLSDDYWKSAEGRTTEQTLNLPIEIQFLDDSTYMNIVQELGLPAEEYAVQSGKIIAVAKMQSGQVDEVSQLPDLFTKSSLNVSVTPKTEGGENMEQGQTINLTFVSTVPPDTPPINDTYESQPYFFQIMAPWSMKERLVPQDGSAEIRVKGLTFQSENPSQSTAEMQAVIQGKRITSSYILLNTSKSFEESRNYIFIANVFSYTFIIMISLIAVANVFNTISTNIKLRRQELAMLRSVGMSDRDFNRMMRFECAFYGLRALLIGLPLAVVASWLIHEGIFMGDVDFILPWSSIGISVFSVLLVIFVTMMYAVSKLKRENIIDALRDDMT